MIFTLVVSILNAVGWISLYLGIGGYTEEPKIIFMSIATMVIASAVGGVVAFLGKDISSNPFFNIFFIISSTSIVSCPFINLLFDSVSTFHKVFGFFSWGFMYCIFLSIIGLLPNDYKCRNILEAIAGRIMAILLILIFGITLGGNSLGIEVWGAGFAVSIPMGLVLGIKNSFN